MIDQDDGILALAFARFPNAVAAEISRFARRNGAEFSFYYSAKITLQHAGDFVGAHAESKVEAMNRAIGFAEWSLENRGKP